MLILIVTNPPCTALWDLLNNPNPQLHPTIQCGDIMSVMQRGDRDQTETLALEYAIGVMGLLAGSDRHWGRGQGKDRFTKQI